MLHQTRRAGGRVRAIGAVVLALCAAPQALALVIASGTGSVNDNTTVVGDPLFAAAYAQVSNTTFGGGSDTTYLGHGVVIGVTHQAIKYGKFDGVLYDLQSAQGEILTGADARIVRIIGSQPNLPTLFTTSQTPSVGDEVRMAGTGMRRNGAEIHYGVTVNSPVSWTWTLNANGPDGTVYGFTRTGPDQDTLRWGTNVIEAVNVNFGGDPRHFLTTFTRPADGGTTHEAQGAPEDSGGPVFWFNPNTNAWELAGLMRAAGYASGQMVTPPASLVAFEADVANNHYIGWVTLMVDLAPHRAQIIHFMTTIKQQNSPAFNGPNPSQTLLTDNTYTSRGHVGVTFTSATNLVLNAKYQTVFSDVVDAYLQSQSVPFSSFDFVSPGDTIQMWMLNVSSGSFTGPATLVFHYDTAMFDVGVDENDLAIFHYHNGAWEQVLGLIDTNLHTITITTNSFSPFALGLMENQSIIPEPGTLALLLLGLSALPRRPARRRGI